MSSILRKGSLSISDKWISWLKVTIQWLWGRYAHISYVENINYKISTTIVHTCMYIYVYAYYMYIYLYVYYICTYNKCIIYKQIYENLGYLDDKMYIELHFFWYS